MKTGTSGSVRSIRPAVTRSIEATKAITATGTTHASTTCGRYRANAVSSASTPFTAAVATSALSAPSSAAGRSRSLRSTTSSLSSDSTRFAALLPATSNPQAAAARATTTATRSTSGTVTSASVAPSKRPCRDPGEQHGLDEDEQGGEQSEGRVDDEQHTRCAPSAQQARIDGPHGLLAFGLPRDEVDRVAHVLTAEAGAEDVVRPRLVEER